MSCVVTMKYKDGWLMISDTQSSTEEMCFNVDDEEDGKMLRAIDDKKAIFGHTGEANNISIIKHIPHLTNDFSDKYPTFDYRYVAEVLMPKVRKYYANIHLISKPSDKFQTQLLIARDDKCFCLLESGSIITIADWYTIGSGSLAALGSLRGTIREPNNIKRGLKAVDAATRLDIYCSYPIMIGSTNNDKFYILSKQDVKDILEGRKELDL